MGEILGANVESKTIHSENLSYRSLLNPDFNLYFDPEVAHIALHAPWAKIIAAGDVTDRVVLMEVLLAKITAKKNPVTVYLRQFAQLDVPLWDEMAAAIVVDPTLIKKVRHFPWMSTSIMVLAIGARGSTTIKILLI